MTLLDLLLELMAIMDLLDWGWCPWWQFGLLRCALTKLCLKFGWNQFSLKASRTLSKMDDIAGVDKDHGCSWLELVSLMTFWMVFVFVWSLSFKFHWNVFSLSYDIAWFRVSYWVGWGRWEGQVGPGGWVGPWLNLGIWFGWSISSFIRLWRRGNFLHLFTGSSPAQKLIMFYYFMIPFYFACSHLALNLALRSFVLIVSGNRSKSK